MLAEKVQCKFLKWFVCFQIIVHTLMSLFVRLIRTNAGGPGVRGLESVAYRIHDGTNMNGFHRIKRNDKRVDEDANTDKSKERSKSKQRSRIEQNDEGDDDNVITFQSKSNQRCKSNEDSVIASSSSSKKAKINVVAKSALGTQSSSKVAQKKSIVKSDPDASDSDASDSDASDRTTDVLVDGVWVNMNENTTKRFKESHPDKDVSKFCIQCAAEKVMNAKFCCVCGFSVKKRK
jgi:hypothetical protein